MYEVGHTPPGYSPAVAKRRLDTLLAERGLFESRSRAAAAVIAGDVRVGGRPARKPGELVTDEADLAVAEAPPFVSRGGVKLASALDAFGIAPGGRRALDVGASTGGFTDCLLQRGAESVIALDVAYGELHWQLRNDERVTVIERRNARSLRPDELPYAPDLIVADVSFISLTKVLPACGAALRPARDGQTPVRGRARARGQGWRGALCRGPALGAGGGRPARGSGAGRLGPGLRTLGPRGACGQPRELRLDRRGGPRGRGRGHRGRRSKGRAVSRPPRSLIVFTHARPEQTSDALRRVIEMARVVGVEVRLAPDEVKKHGIEPQEGVTLDANPEADTDLAVVLGGDGTILRTLRLFAGRRVTVFAVNFGTIGFLATVEPAELEEGMGMALAGELDGLELPGLMATTAADGDVLAMNDMSFHRRDTGRVAELAYSVEGEELGEVRCDGLVVATPAGSTGYNRANGGPVLAWGVEGYVVSFIAPHTLTARALVVAPDDVLAVTNRSREEDVEMTTDGRAVCVLPREDTITVRFKPRCAQLAQLPGASFYHRLRDKFGRLAS